jgi:hypothetical protein
MEPLKETALKLQEFSAEKGMEATLQMLSAGFPGSITFSTSFGLEDQVVTDIFQRITSMFPFLRLIPGGFSRKLIPHGAAPTNNTELK